MMTVTNFLSLIFLLWFTKENSMKIISKLLCVTTIVSIIFISITAYAHDGHSDEDMIIKNLGDLGSVNFSASCNADAQKAINTGVGLLHHMMYAQAEIFFGKWMEKEPGCAILYWGYSMSLFHPLWPDSIKDEALVRGQSVITKAQQLKATKREKAYINAAAKYYQNWQNVADKDRTTKWAEAQSLVYQQNPDDIDAIALFALSLLVTAPKDDPLFSQNKVAGELLAKLIETSPSHPGAIHYTIHAYDNPPLANLAIEAARAYDKIAPDVPHSLHMPSHIFVRLGMWNDAVGWNLRSAKAALKYPAKGETSLQYTHAMDYLIYAYLQLGEGDKAEQSLKQAESHHPVQAVFATAYAFAAMPARIALEQKNWQQASQIKIQHPSYIPWQKFPQVEAITYYARGLGAARSGDLNLAQQNVEVLNDLYDKTKITSPDYWAPLVDAQRRVVNAWISFGNGQKEQALLQLRQAADIEDSIDKDPVTPGAVLPARELLADMLLLNGDYSGALTAYRSTSAISPNRLNSLSGVKDTRLKISKKK
jgi:tetratricopeptide (TPR) repeat protein